MTMLMRMDQFPVLSGSRMLEPVRFSKWMDDLLEDSTKLNRGRFVPELNVFETQKEFQVTLALPGMRKEDIEVSLENNTLVISGERKPEEENGRKYHYIESRFGRFTRSLPFPDIIDADNVSANYENGVLTITVPKIKEKAGKAIPIK